MGKTNKKTKKFIHKGGLKQAIAKRPVEKKIKESKDNRLHKAREYDERERSDKSVEEQFKKDLERLISQKKKLPTGEDQLDISEFLQKGFDSDDDFEDISDDDGGDLEFGNEGQQMKGGKKKGKKQIIEDDLSEGEEFEDEEGEDDGEEFENEGEDEEGEDAEMQEGEGEEAEDDDDGLIEDEGAEFDEEDEEEDDEGEGRVTKKDRTLKGRKLRRKEMMEENLQKLLGEDGTLSDLEEEVAAHKQELKGLQESDPSFFEYLAKEGKDVLNFDKLSREMKEKKQIESGGIITVTSPLLHTWISNAIEKDSIEDVKKILTAFQVSVMTEDEAVESQMPFRIAKETVYNELIVFCLEHMTDLFYDLLGDSAKNIKPAKPTDTPSQKQQIQLESIPAFAKIKKLVYIYANVVMKLLEDTSDANMLSFIIKHLVQFIPFISTSTSHSKKFLQSLLRIWASTSAEAIARMSSFICLRQLALFRPFPFINTVLRGIYLIFMHNCKSMNSNETLASVAFMRDCVVEMYGVDFECSYQHMFTYLRQLAVTLQKALVAQSQETLGQVYSWQYLNALQLWSSVLSAYPNQQNLTHLLYPLVQVIQGSLTLDGTAKYYPYRIHLIRMLNSLAQANTNTFINSLPYTLDLLNGPLLQDTFPQGDKKILVDFKVMRKVTDNILHTKQFQDELVNQITELLTTNLAAYAYSISFPEYSTFAIKLIGEYIKRVDEGRSSHLGQLLTSVEQNAVFIRRLREKSDKAPKDITNAVRTFFSSTLKNTEKAPVALFIAKFSKQVDKWEAALKEKRAKMSTFHSDNEAGADDSDDEESPATTKQNEEMEKAEIAKREKEVALKRKKDALKVKEMTKFGGDIVEDLVLSEDDEEEEAPKKKAKIEKSPKTEKKSAKTEKSPKKEKKSAKPEKSPKKQNGTTTNTKGDKKPKKKN